MMQPIAKVDESSAMFTLHELMKLEEQRLKAEEAERTRKQDEARRVAAERAAQQARDEEARLAREASEREARVRAEREEQARLAAMREAIVAQQVAEQERKARIEAEARRYEHEQQLARIAENTSARKLKKALFAVSVATVTSAALGLGLYFGKIKPESEAKALIAQQEADEQRKAAADAQKARDELNAKLERLEQERAAAKTKTEADTKQKEIDAIKRKLPTVVGTAPVVKQNPVETKGEDCPRGDPLCGLKR